jgi:hypothetical protein
MEKIAIMTSHSQQSNKNKYKKNVNKRKAIPG